VPDLPPPPPARPPQAVAPLGRRLLAESVGTALQVAIVVGSGIAAQQLSPSDTGLQLLQNSMTTVLGLGVLILLFGPSRARISRVFGGVAGAVLANLMFALPAVQVSGHVRSGAGLWIGEVVATAALIAVIVALARTGRAALSAGAVATWIGAAYWFTSSTSFANPAVTVARMFSDTFTGISPASVLPFIVFQIVGAALGAVLVVALYPDAPQTAAAVVVPHDTPPSPAAEGTTR
jgi:glycerol uptake facilitator-like aquaporin